MNKMSCWTLGMMIILSKYQTKLWRQGQVWYKNGRFNECENYQRRLIAEITQQECKKTMKRLNINTLELSEIKKPMLQDDGFNWTENFDGIQEKDGNELLYNMKMICDTGGAQTRSLREVYHFIGVQMKYLSAYNNEDKNSSLYFINILDGDACHRHRDKFIYILNIPEYVGIKNRVFVGDMHEFKGWFQDRFSNRCRIWCMPVQMRFFFWR